MFRLRKLIRSRLVFSTIPKRLSPRRLSRMERKLRSKDSPRRLVSVSNHYFVNESIVLGFKTPLEAKTGEYVDKKCPFTSDVSIRGRIFKGVVLSNKMKRTVILRRDYLHYIRKYNRFEKRHHNLPAHLSPAFARTQIGNVVTVGQCRPLCKTVRFNVLRVEKKFVQGNIRKTFVMF